LKIAIVGPTWPIRGGIAHYTTLMVQKLTERHDVLFVSYSKQYPQFLFPGRTQIDDSEERIEADCEPLISFANFFSWRKAARRIARERPDALVFSWVNPALAVQFRYISGVVKKLSPSTEIVFWCHNVTGHESRPLEVSLTRFAFARGDRFIVHGEQIKETFKELDPSARVMVADHPVYDVFATQAVTRGEAREELGIADDAPVVLYFGFVRAYKGLVHLIDAMPAALETLPDARLLIVGEFWDDVEEYRSAVSGLGIEGSVTIEDSYVPNERVAVYFRAADLVALPYVSATASGIVQIAYGFDKPVLTTRVGSLPEVVVDGETGYLVPPADPEALAAAIVEFFTGAGRDEFSANVARYRERFSWDRFVERVEEILGA
jgi:glycosyltransferase involved in cell wall biosynthesis